jgi:hypothetical protein
MAFASTITKNGMMPGTGRVTFGTWTTDTTTGDIDTGLLVCEAIFLQTTGGTASASQATVNKTLPCAGNAVTIVGTSAIPGNWMAIGY